jgi:hypothetical protein
MMGKPHFPGPEAGTLTRVQGESSPTFRKRAIRPSLSGRRPAENTPGESRVRPGLEPGFLPHPHALKLTTFRFSAIGTSKCNRYAETRRSSAFVS